MAAYEPKPRPSLFDDGEDSIMNQIDELLDGHVQSAPAEPTLAELAFTEPALTEPAQAEPAQAELVAAEPELIEPVAAAPQPAEDVERVSVPAASSAATGGSGPANRWLVRAGVAIVVVVLVRRVIRRR